MDILNIEDWRKITMKYTGLCVHCKKKIQSGYDGYWSRSFKVIIHDDCYDSIVSKKTNFSNTSSAKKVNSISNSNIHTFLTKNNNKIPCYICGRLVDLDDPFLTSLLNLDNCYNNIETLFCSNCLQNVNSQMLSNYKARFLNDLG